MTATFRIRRNSNGWNVESLNVLPGAEVQPGKTVAEPAPTDYLSSLASRHAMEQHGANRITTHRGRCTRSFSQAATKRALFSQATLSRINLARRLRARVGPFASEQDAAAACWPSQPLISDAFDAWGRVTNTP